MLQNKNWLSRNINFKFKLERLQIERLLLRWKLLNWLYGKKEIGLLRKI
jgi:hypothetical protein